MKIDGTTNITATLVTEKTSTKGTLTFVNDAVGFKPYQITTQTPEIKIAFSQILDALVEKALFMSVSITIVDKNSNSYKFNTTQSGNIMRFLYDKF